MVILDAGWPEKKMRPLFSHGSTWEGWLQQASSRCTSSPEGGSEWHIVAPPLCTPHNTWIHFSIKFQEWLLQILMDLFLDKLVSVVSARPDSYLPHSYDPIWMSFTFSWFTFTLLVSVAYPMLWPRQPLVSERAESLVTMPFLRPGWLHLCFYHKNWAWEYQEVPK